MKIGFLGCHPEYNHKDIETIKFSSDTTILEYDMLVIDLENIFNSYGHSGEYNGLPTITNHDSTKLKSDLNKRKIEIKEFLESGKNIIVICGNDNCVYCYTGKKDTSGVGKNAVTTYYVEDVHSTSLLPVEIKSIKLSGKRITLKNKKLEEIFKKYKDYLEYQTVYENVKDNILMTINDTKKVVSYFEQIGKGVLIFAPNLGFSRKDSRGLRIEKDYYNDLNSLNKILSKSELKLPAFSKKYMLPTEEEMINNIEKDKIKLEKLALRVKEKEKTLIGIQNEKIMFVGTGTPLEMNSVENFKKIGFTIIKYDPDSVDEDIVIKYKEEVAVVEVKGVSGSATEKHTSQIVKWKSEYHIENNILPKGILVVNAFNERELEDRQEYFPDQMLKYAMHQEICLLTTIQLYNIKEYLKDNPKEKDKIIKTLFDTIGLYQGFEDWNMYIKKI